MRSYSAEGLWQNHGVGGVSQIYYRITGPQASGFSTHDSSQHLGSLESWPGGWTGSAEGQQGAPGQRGSSGPLPSGTLTTLRAQLGVSGSPITLCALSPAPNPASILCFFPWREAAGRRSRQGVQPEQSPGGSIFVGQGCPYLRLLIFNLDHGGPLPWIPQFVKKI